jgi:hypothetical protein
MIKSERTVLTLLAAARMPAALLRHGHSVADWTLAAMMREVKRSRPSGGYQGDNYLITDAGRVAWGNGRQNEALL